MKLVAPSILSADFANLEAEIKKIAAAGADWLHVDVMDGMFVPNITIGMPVVESIRKVTSLPLDVHLMIEKPERYVESFLKAGSDWLTLHVESTSQMADSLNLIRSKGKKAGITLRPKTSLKEVEPFLSLADLVLVMTVEPGFGGQSFMQDQVRKIDDLATMRKKNNYKYLIEVDGGINATTARECKNADVFVAGNFVFKNNYAESIRQLKES